jgi:wyosine [tRNA(Phe)-imidazoG37] synthetase (radical SAM superfamily)
VDRLAETKHKIAFGPVPSRRLGRSLGINNIPPKVCTYSCVYCQVGRTLQLTTKRRSFYSPEEVFEGVQEKVGGAQQEGESIDYLTFVPDGEPTLDKHLGREVELLRSLGIKIGVISNSSMIWDPEVREALMGADWVSLKVDAVREDVWRRINRPHGSLRLPIIQDGIREFARSFRGDLVTETMLVREVNDSEERFVEVAEFMGGIKPNCAYLSIPIRPPSEDWVRPPDENRINRAYQVLSGRIDRVEYLIGYEGNAFAFTGNVEEDLLSITSVHPMREDAVKDYLTRAKANWSVVNRLVEQGKLAEVEYKNRMFYVRKL